MNTSTYRTKRNTRTKPIVTESIATEEQTQVLAMRYNLQLDDAKVNHYLIQVHTVIKKGKQSA